MEAQFWFDSWDEGGGKTSFHRRDIHPYARKYFPPERLRDRRFLVPLCGKTIDMMYFREHAGHVVGVELVEKAVHQFFDEQGLAFDRRGNRFEAEGLTIVCGDVFALTPDDVGPIDDVYDRAALVALPLPMRRRYVAKVDALLPLGGEQFVNTLEYGPAMDSPPFSVTPAEVIAYYGQNYSIEHLEQPSLPEHGMVRKFGLTFFKEHGFRLRKTAMRRTTEAGAELEHFART